MKKYILTFIVASLLIGCADDDKYGRLNEDPKNPTTVSEDFLFTNAVNSLGDLLASPNVNRNVYRFVSQYLTSTTYLDEPNYKLVSRNVPQSQWSILYRNVLKDLDDAKSYIADNDDLTQAEKDARLGQIEVVQVYAWQFLVDTFGNIPYTEALNGEEVTSPAYDDAAVIYEDLLARIQDARTKIQGGDGFGGPDLIFSGNMAKWEKFSNSLQLRLAMRIADVGSMQGMAQDLAEDAISSGAGVMASNDDSAVILYQSSPPNTNPLWVDLVQSGRSDYVAANTVVDAMNDLDDPRRAYYFVDNLGAGVYDGGIYGGENTYANYTHIGDDFLDPTHPGIYMDYTEVSFLLAEAAARTYSTPKTADAHYEDAITASMNYAGIDDQAAIDSYITQVDVAFDAANWRESIGEQFWLAMFDNPFQGWAVWRKFDAPTFNLPEDTGNPVPLRYKYPVNEQNLNEDNYDDASSAIGGDTQQTALFWDTM